MSCSIEETQGVTVLLYYWFINGSQDITPDQDNHRVSITSSPRVSITSSSSLQSGSLLISSVTRGDTGLYVCQILIRNNFIQNKSSGKGTRLTVTAVSSRSLNDYLYGLLLLIPLWIVIFILWRHQRKIKGNKPGPAEPQGGRNLTLQDQDGEPELQYASLLPGARDPKPKTKQPRKQIPEGQSTEYNTVSVKNTPQANPVRLGQDRAEPYVCYATLRMSPAQTQINDPGGTGQDQQEPETTYARVRVAERKAKVTASHDAPRDQG